ncbi:hypothetical protein E4T42_00269 [Aureobasidium subglaciale]|nr:hypothetical protein E4T42_00269 [Aureobasidium subglaciale]
MTMPPLSTFSPSVGVVSSCIAKSQTTLAYIPTSLYLRKQCSADIHVLSTADNTPLSVGSKILTFDRPKNKNGKPNLRFHQVLDVDKNLLIEVAKKNKLRIVSSGSNKEIGQVALSKKDMGSWWTRRKLESPIILDLTIKNMAGSGEQVTLKIRARNNTNSVGDVFVGQHVMMRFEGTSDSIYPEATK